MIDHDALFKSLLRTGDLLIKTRFRGEEAAFLIHLEHEAQARSDLAKRMLEYLALDWRDFGLPVYPIAVLSHPEISLKPMAAEVGAVGPTAPGAHPAAPAMPQVASGRRDLLLPAPHRLFSSRWRASKLSGWRCSISDRKPIWPAGSSPNLASLCLFETS